MPGTLPTLNGQSQGVCMRCPTKVGESSWQSNACYWLTGLLRICSPSLNRFQSSVGKDSFWSRGTRNLGNGPLTLSNSFETWLSIVFVTIGHVRYIKYSNMAPRLSGQTSIYGVLFFVSVSFGNWGTKATWKISNFDPNASEPCLNIDISNVVYTLCR